MKASSIGLEVEAEIVSKELGQLKSRFLEGKLVFRDNADSPKRDILLYMFYSPFQKERIEYEMEPLNGYFGSVSHIEFTINGEVYQELKESGNSGGRFSLGGKLEITIKGRETYKNL